MNRDLEVKRIIRTVLSELETIELSGYSTNGSFKMKTDIRYINQGDSVYCVGLNTYDLKIGGYDDEDSNDSLLEQNLRREFKRILKKVSKELKIVDEIYSEKGSWGFYVSFDFKNKEQYVSTLKKQQEKISKKEKEVQKYQDELTAFNSNITQRIKNQKSKKKTCSNCGSSINVSYFTSHKCPVCNTEMYTATDLKRANNLKDKITKHKKELNNLKNK